MTTERQIVDQEEYYQLEIAVWGDDDWVSAGSDSRDTLEGGLFMLHKARLEASIILGSAKLRLVKKTLTTEVVQG